MDLSRARASRASSEVGNSWMTYWSWTTPSAFWPSSSRAYAFLRSAAAALSLAGHYFRSSVKSLIASGNFRWAKCDSPIQYWALSDRSVDG